jgi:thioredoxin-related protein
MQKVTFGLLIGLFASVGMTKPAMEGMERPTPELRWLTIQQAQDSSREQPRVIIMDIYTDWCYWCKVMERNTYSNRELASYLQEKFYPVKFNAENKSSITWKGQSFAFNDAYKVNELALSLTHGQLSFPTTVIITPDNNAPQFISGYLKPAEIEPILKYFGEGAYKKESYKDFNRAFKPTWKYFFIFF